MATTYRTVSEEMAWTDWSAREQTALRPATTENRPSVMGVLGAVLAGAAMLAGVIYLLPPGVH